MRSGAIYPSLKGKTVFITGGASGIGAALVRSFSQQGASVGFIDTDEVAAEILTDEIERASGQPAWFRKVDVRDIPALQAAVEALHIRTSRLDVLVNNVANDQRHQPLEVSEQGWRDCLAVNLDSAFFASQAAIRLMLPVHSGSIINFSSINAVTGPAEMPGYVTAKAALLGLNKALARQYGPEGIRVNAILPGWIATERQLASWLTPEIEAEWLSQTALRRRVLPDEVARLALFLASDDSAAITNQQFIIDGGKI